MYCPISCRLLVDRWDISCVIDRVLSFVKCVLALTYREDWNSFVAGRIQTRHHNRDHAKLLKVRGHIREAPRFTTTRNSDNAWYFQPIPWYLGRYLDQFKENVLILLLVNELCNVFFVRFPYFYLKYKYSNHQFKNKFKGSEYRKWRFLLCWFQKFPGASFQHHSYFFPLVGGPFLLMPPPALEIP